MTVRTPVSEIGRRREKSVPARDAGEFSGVIERKLEVPAAFFARGTFGQGTRQQLQ
jgi:hypothetical protein